MKYKGKLRGMVGQGIARRRCERAVCVPVLILHFFAHLVFMFACVKCYCAPREMLGNCFLENQISYDTASRMPRCKWPLATKCCQHVPIACRDTAAVCVGFREGTFLFWTSHNSHPRCRFNPQPTHSPPPNYRFKIMHTHVF